MEYYKGIKMTETEALKEMYKAHLGNSIFNIDKLEALIIKLVQEKNEVQEELGSLNEWISENECVI